MNNRVTKPDTIELLKESYAIIDGIPEKYFALHDFISKNGESPKDNKPMCGTVGCAGGWLAMHPAMNEKGLKLSSNKFPKLCKSSGILLGFDALKEFFGFDTFSETESIFGFCGASEYDRKIILSDNCQISDKNLWLARVRMYLKERCEL